MVQRALRAAAAGWRGVWAMGHWGWHNNFNLLRSLEVCLGFEISPPSFVCSQ